MKTCIKFNDRFKGLMFKKYIDNDYLCSKCKSIHTFFMKINIDVIALNKNGQIIKIYKDVHPNKIILAPKNTYSILETKTNSNYKIGDIIKEANFKEKESSKENL